MTEKTASWEAGALSGMEKAAVFSKLRAAWKIRRMGGQQAVAKEVSGLFRQAMHFSDVKAKKKFMELDRLMRDAGLRPQ